MHTKPSGSCTGRANRSAFAWLETLEFQRTADFVYWHDGGASGHSDLHVYRYDRPPDDAALARWDSGILLRSANVDIEDLRVDLLLQTWEPQSLDYVISAKLLDADGALRAQYDSQPQLNQRPTRGWSIGELVYSPHELRLLDVLEPGSYEVVVQLYHAGDGISDVLTVDGRRAASIGAIDITEARPAAGSR